MSNPQAEFTVMTGQHTSIAVRVEFKLVVGNDRTPVPAIGAGLYFVPAPALVVHGKVVEPAFRGELEVIEAQGLHPSGEWRQLNLDPELTEFIVGVMRKPLRKFLYEKGWEVPSVLND